MVTVTIVSRGIGFLREGVIAFSYGASLEVDLFLVALTLPAILITTVFYSIPNAFVPLWNSSSSRPRYTVVMALALIVASLIVTATIWWFAGPLMRMLAAGFEVPLQVRAITLLRVGSAAIVFAVIEAILRSRLLASKKFALPGLSYVLQSVGVVVGAIWWRESGALGLMWGVVVGTAMAAVWNMSLLAAYGNVPSRSPESVAVSMSPGRIVIWVSLVLVTDSLSQLYALVDRNLGSYLQSGAISALNYASLTAGLPSSIIGLALSTAILPFLSDADSSNDLELTRSIIDHTIRWALLIAVPISLWMLVFRSQITSVLFFRGAFDANSLGMTSSALSAAALGIVPGALATVWSRPFYASRSWIPITVIAVGALISKAIFSVALVQSFGSSGLALSTSCAFSVAACLSAYMQRTHIRPHLGEWAAVAAKALLLVGIPALIGYCVIESLAEAQTFTRNLVAITAILSGSVILILGGKRWGIRQMDELSKALSGRRF